MDYKGGELTVELGGKRFHCALDVSMAFLGGKWKAVVLWYLLDGGRQRYSQLKRRMPDITERMLSLQLKALEKDGLILRRAYGEVPPRVDYELSPEGRSLAPALRALAAWGRRKSRKDGKLYLDGKPLKKPPA